MIRNTRDSGSMENSPASEFTMPPKTSWKDERENGKEARESDGLTKHALFIKNYDVNTMHKLQELLL